MTVASPANRKDYLGNAAALSFAFPYPFTLAEDLYVMLTDTGLATTYPMLNSDYTVTGAGDPAGGAVVFVVAPASGTAIAIIRQPALTQDTHFVEGDKFPAAGNEAALDALCMQVQEVAEEVGRSLRLAPTYPLQAEIPTPIEGSVVGWVSGKWAWLSGATVSLAANLLSTESGALGAALVGFDWALTYTAGTVGAALNDLGSVLSGKGDALIGVKQPFTGATARTQHDKNTEHISVKDFGAIGDGSTDDTAAVQAALNATLSGNTIRFPAGVYKIAALTIDSPFITFQGDGMYKAGTYGASTLNFSGTGTMLNITTLGKVFINDMMLNNYSGSGNVYTAGQIAIKTYADLDCTRTCFQGWDNAVYWQGGYYHKFKGCRFTYLNKAFYGATGFNANNLSLIGCKCDNFNTLIATSGGAGPITLSHSAFEHFTSYLVQGVSGNRPAVNFDGNYIENYGTAVATGLTGTYTNAGVLFSGVSSLKMSGNSISTTGLLRLLDNTGVQTDSVVSTGNTIYYGVNGASYPDNLFIFVGLKSGLISDTLVQAAQGGTATHTNTTKMISAGSTYDKTYTGMIYDDTVAVQSEVLPPWIPVVGGVGFLNGWANNGTTSYSVAAYRRIGKRVYLKGSLTGAGASNNSIWTFPAGYYDTSNYVSIRAQSNSGTPTLVWIRIDPSNGNIRCDNTTYTGLTNITLDGTYFDLDA